MILRHATTTANAGQIRREGLRVAHALGKEKAIWLHTTSKTHWAIAHTQKRHGVSLEEVIILEVNVPRSQLKRAWKGLWKCYADISMTRHIGTGVDFAASPLE